DGLARPAPARPGRRRPGRRGVGHVPAPPGLPLRLRRTGVRRAAAAGRPAAPPARQLPPPGPARAGRRPRRGARSPARGDRPGRQRGGRGGAADRAGVGRVHPGRAGRAGRPAGGRGAAGGGADRPAAPGADPADQPRPPALGPGRGAAPGVPAGPGAGRGAVPAAAGGVHLRARLDLGVHHRGGGVRAAARGLPGLRARDAHRLPRRRHPGPVRLRAPAGGARRQPRLGGGAGARPGGGPRAGLRPDERLPGRRPAPAGRRRPRLRRRGPHQRRLLRPGAGRADLDQAGRRHRGHPRPGARAL
ncbi:MAG: Protein containing transglutaminase-like domain, putative cysteine protease, partial [uncultured Corynebacteriales bacterium]